MKKALFGVIFSYLFAGLLFYAALFGESTPEDDVLDTIVWFLMASFSLVVAIIATGMYIRVIRASKQLPTENSREWKELVSREDVMFEILKLENPGVSFDPKYMSFKELQETYKIEERFADKSIEDLTEMRNGILESRKARRIGL
jgi:hypothetical protein